MVAITEAVALEKEGEIGMLWIDNPPVNALGFPVRKGMADGIAMAMKDDSIKAVVVICKGGTFCAGADIREFGKPPKEPHLPDVLTAFDACTKPIIAAVHGTAFGGGLETALSSHFRVAVATAQFGLPEVKLGLLPGAGGTQRLPRLIGPARAKELIYSGRHVRADEALALGIADRVVPADEVYEAALNWAREYAEGPAVALAAAKTAVDDGLAMGLAEGLRLESSLFAGLFGTDDRTAGMRNFLESGPGHATFTGN